MILIYTGRKHNLNPLPHNPGFYLSWKKKASEDNVGKGENPSHNVCYQRLKPSLHIHLQILAYNLVQSNMSYFGSLYQNYDKIVDESNFNPFPNDKF